MVQFYLLFKVIDIAVLYRITTVNRLFMRDLALKTHTKGIISYRISFFLKSFSLLHHHGKTTVRTHRARQFKKMLAHYEQYRQAGRLPARYAVIYAYAPGGASPLTVGQTAAPPALGWKRCANT